MDQDLMPIGRFARRCRLSVKQLRHYDVPLLAIGQVLAGRDVVAVLGAVKDRLEADPVRRRRMLATLNRILTQGLPRAEVRLTCEDARRVAITTAAGTVEEIGPVTSDCGPAWPGAGRGWPAAVWPVDRVVPVGPISDPQRTAPEQLVTQLMIKLEEEAHERVVFGG
jgi:hypothetical protein